MEVKDLLTAALEAVDDAEIPDDLRPIAFEKAVNLLAGSQSTIGESKDGADLSKGRTAGTGPHSGTTGTLLDLVAQKLKVSRDVIGDIYREADGDIRLIIGTRRLETGKAAGARQVALLVAAGRQAAGLEDFTPLERIKDEAERFKKFDSKNFATTMGKMSTAFTFDGSGKSRAVRLSQPGWEEAADLVNAFAGGEV